MLKRAGFLSLPVQHGALKQSIRAHRHLSEVIRAICLQPIKLSDYKNEFCHFLYDTFVSNTHSVLLQGYRKSERFI